MKLGAFIEGLLILQPYYDNGDGYHIGADHDQFYCYQTDRPVSPKDVKKLRRLGWFQPDAPDDAEYDADDGWSVFT